KKNDKNALDKKKDDAKKEIDKLPNLTPDEKQKAKDAIDKAEDGKTIDKIVEDANKLNNTREKKSGYKGSSSSGSSSSSSSNGKNLPSTGEVAGSAGIIGLALIGVAGLFGFAKKRKNEEDETK
ncbi:LPXTG cell wall anchor domain-containing protein, partial [Floricoccus penangensis]|uniref:LPXTG cell wall anchor domain-containing protein n=1 Tax=Floricoccus penangensis TaxID=1859475 RepID=UPI000A5798B2